MSKSLHDSQQYDQVLEQAIKYRFATQCLRDIADYDYISARTLFRYNCFDQFLYFAHQCIEKYLKAILLFNNFSIQKDRHDLQKLLKKVQAIKDINLSSNIDPFVKDLNHTYFARYLSAPFSAKKEHLLNLDSIVWELRLYCTSNKAVYKIKTKDDKNKMLKFLINGGQLYRGKLEEIIKKDKYKVLRSNLVWKNFYYGKRLKKKITFSFGYWSKNPNFFLGGVELQQTAYEVLSKYVYFEKPVRDYFEKLSNN